MPNYEYSCCIHGVFEAYKPLSEYNAPAACPTCGRESERIVSAPILRVLGARTRIAMERNEKSQHEPRRHRTGRDGPAPVKKKAEPRYARNPRPWMVG